LPDSVNFAVPADFVVTATLDVMCCGHSRCFGTFKLNFITSTLQFTIYSLQHCLLGLTGPVGPPHGLC